MEFRSHLEMLGLPEWVLMTTWSMAARKWSHKDLEPKTVAQVPVRKRRDRGRGKPVLEVPTVREEADPEGDSPVPTGEDIFALGVLPELAEWRAAVAPSQAEFCKVQKECPTLEGI